ncbi:MAG: dTMP kinase [Verrucomicrobiota bacterium]
MVKRGTFISFEGSEGSGKTTQIDFLQQWLEKKQIPIITLREPGGTPVGEAIRHLLKHDPAGADMSAETELLLFCASRAELVRKIIIPALEKGTWVITDRFHDSTQVYQGIARHLDLRKVKAINAFALKSICPDITFFLDMPAEISYQRMLDRYGPNDRIEQEPLEFFEEVRQGYLKLAHLESSRIHIIQGDGNREEVFNLIQKELIDAIPSLGD